MTWKRGSMGGAKGPRKYAPVLGVAAAIVALTLLPVRGTPPATGLSLEIDTWRGLADAIANVGLFVPFGLALGIAGGRFARSLLLGLAFSFFIEVVQLAVPGRYSSLNDLVFNTAGVAIGLVLVRWALPLLRSGPRVSTLLAGTAVTVALAIALGGSRLLRPDMPMDSILFGQWTPDHSHLTPYQGHVVSARIADIRIPSWRIRRSSELREHILAGDTLFLRFVAGPPVADLASIFNVYDHRQQEMILVGIDGDDAIFRIRAAGRRIGLDHPDHRYERAFAGIRAGDSVRVRIWRDANRNCLAVNEIVECKRVFTARDTWALVAFWSRLGTVGRAAVGALWMFLLFVPTGFWLRSPSAAAGLAACVATLLIVLPFAIWRGPMVVADGVPAALGTVAGYGLFRRFGRQPQSDSSAEAETIRML